VNPASRHGWFVRLFSSAIISQAVLSAASLAVGLLLVRQGSGEQYGWYVLVANAFLLLSSLQNAFFGPTLILRLTPLEPAARTALIGHVHMEQLRLLQLGSVPALLLLGLSWAGGFLHGPTAALLLTASFAAPLVLSREYCRAASLALQRAHDVVRADLLYAVLLVAAGVAAARTPLPAAAAVLGLGTAAWFASRQLSRRLYRGQRPVRQPGLLRQFAAVGLWSSAGAAIHWMFSQGYGYLVAATLDVGAVAALAATRLLLMPVNLLSTGVSSLMLPMTAGWLREHSAQRVLQRLLLVAASLSAAACLYLAVMWLLRDWLFAHVLKKQFAQRDRLLLLWSLVSILMLLRDQTVHLIVARGQLRRLTLMTLCSALLSLLIAYWGIRRFGVCGALFGVLCGEASNLAGILLTSAAEVRRQRLPAAAQAPDEGSSEAATASSLASG
jgi:O-antigen/teichoic acid export membrane protein